MPTAQWIDIADKRIAYVESSGTGRPVVFLHGNSSSSTVWHQVLDGAVGRRHRCLALDLPGHGRSDHAARVEDYSLPSYAAVLSAFLEASDVEQAVVVGWSLGGHVALEAAPRLDRAAGFVVSGTPPIGRLSDFAQAFLPNPALEIGFTSTVDRESALIYATFSLAPDSPIAPHRSVDEILATDGAARLGLGASVQAGHFADEPEIVRRLTRPLAVLHGEHDQLVSLEYLRGLAMPSLWRGAVQIVPDAGHTPMVEAPQDFHRLLGEFLADLD